MRTSTKERRFPTAAGAWKAPLLENRRPIRGVCAATFAPAPSAILDSAPPHLTVGSLLPMNSFATRALARELLLPCETLFVALPPPGRQSRGEGGHDVRAVAPARN